MRSSLTSPSAAPTIGSAQSTWLAPLLIFVLAGAIYSINLDRLPHPDELYQILPAEGLLATGEPRLADGLYTRALAQTWVIAGSIYLFGHSLEAARLSSLLGVAASAAILFAWLRHEAGRLPAWIGGVGFAVSPFAIQTAQFARIYGLQCLAFLLVALAIYAAVQPKLHNRSDTRRIGITIRPLWLLAALPPLLLAAHLQPTTLLGAVGLGVWAVGALSLRWLLSPDVSARQKKLMILGAVILVAIAFAGAAAVGLVGSLWEVYRTTPIFNEAHANEIWFYHAWYALLYPSLWPLTGIFAIAALAVWPRPASLAICIFAFGFVLNSFAASKALRYITYAQPFLFAVWAMGIAALLPPLTSLVRDLQAHLAKTLPPNGSTTSALLARGAVIAALATLFLANPAWLRTLTLLADVPLPGEEKGPNWAAARPMLESLETVPVVVTTEELGTQYYLGRFDVRFSPSKLREFSEEAEDFALDPRTGRPVIGQVELLSRVIDCYPEGLFVLNSGQWSRSHLFSPNVRDLLLARTQPVKLPPRARVTAFTWKYAPGTVPPSTCASLPPLPGPAARVTPYG